MAIEKGNHWNATIFFFFSKEKIKGKKPIRLTHAWEASKGIIGDGHGPLVLEERWWRWCRDIEDRPGRDVVLGME